MAYRIDLFDSSGARVAIIQEEIISSLSLDTAIDSAPTLTLSIPLSEEKSAYISPAYHLKVWNTTTAAYEHSVFTLCDPDIEDSGGALKITATYQGILTRLSNEDIEAYDTGSAGDTFTNVITALLAYQLNTPAITLGTIEPVQTVALAVENTTIYSALNAVRDAFGGWFEVDADYQLNWYNDNTNTPDREIRRSKNLKSLTYTPSYTQIVNRVYAYGKGESDARITLLDAGEAHEYIEDATSLATYGIMAKRYVDKRITHPTTLLKYAQRILAQYKTPPYQYSVDVVNLAEVRDYDYSLESLGLDTRVRVIDDLLSVDVDTSIVSMSVDLLNPAEITIELSTVKTDLSDLFKDVLTVQNINQSVAAQISAGQVTVLGTFVVKDWATDGETTIDGGNITANTITVDQIQSGVLGNKTYRQAAEPASPSSGDIWIDSDDGNLMYRYDGSAWVVTQDAEIGDAISAASTAQATADGKVTTFYQIGEPTAEGIGDLWIDTDDGNKLYRWSGSAWTEIQDAGIASAIADAATAQTTADGKIVSFYQDSAPTAEGVGDIWFDTDAGNKQYWWNGTAWVASSITPAQTIATINLDGGTVQINGSQISINGDTTFSTGYDPTTKIASGGAATDINNNTTTISGGKITTNTIAANAIKTSTMTARTITLSGADSILQGNYTAGSAGWQIKGDGNAEFNNVTIRGTLAACTISSGQTLTVNGSIYVSGSVSIASKGLRVRGVGVIYIGDVSNNDYIYVSSHDLFWQETGQTYGTKLNHLSTDNWACAALSCTSISCSGSFGSISCTSLSSSGALSGSSINVGSGTVTCGAVSCSGDISCDDISCDDLTVDSIYSASGQIEIWSSIQLSYGSGLHFNGSSSNDVIYSSGAALYWRDAGGTVHQIS